MTGSPRQDQPADPQPAPLWGLLLFRPLVISGMMASISGAWIAAAQFLYPAWNGLYLVAVVMLVVAEVLVTDQLSGRDRDALKLAQLRVAEATVIAMILRLALVLIRPNDILRATERTWLSRPGLLFDDIEYQLALIWTLAMWALALGIADGLRDLEDPYARVVIDPQRRVSLERSEDSGLSFLNRAFLIGAVLLLLPLAFVQLRLSPQSLSVHSVSTSRMTRLPIIYVGLAVLLFGQARLSLLSAQWKRENAPVASSIPRRWALWGFAFVATIGVLAFFLPAASTELGFYLFMWLNYWLAEVLRVIVVLVVLILRVLFFPLWIFLRLGDTIPLVPPQLAASAPPALPPATDDGPLWLTYTRVTVVWAMLLILLVFLLRQFFLNRKSMGTWGIVRWLAGLWKMLEPLLHHWRKSVQALGELVGSLSLDSRPHRGRESRRLWQARTPRERVRRLYASLLERARRAGHARMPPQSPHEYAASLLPHLTGEEESLKTITESFVEARYSANEVGEDEVALTRRMLERLRKLLPPL